MAKSVSLCAGVDRGKPCMCTNITSPPPVLVQRRRQRHMRAEARVGRVSAVATRPQRLEIGIQIGASPVR